MNKIRTRFAIALVTFIIGVIATTLFVLNRGDMSQHQPPITAGEAQDASSLRVIIPNASWEPIFFREINSVTKLSGQSDLRKTNLADGDFEVRVWWGFSLSPLEGVTLRRVVGQWSAIHTKADNYHEPSKATRVELRPPKSGWETFWQRLVDSRILTLPDASELNCNVNGIDGGAYVVEVNRDRTYRTYMYDSPSEAKCNEAKQMIKIGDIIFEEFNLGKSQD
jgi:hypothetical protein